MSKNKKRNKQRKKIKQIFEDVFSEKPQAVRVAYKLIEMGIGVKDINSVEWCTFLEPKQVLKVRIVLKALEEGKKWF